jgi:hypothetical protein
VEMPAGPFHYSIGELLPKRPAPLLGEHTEMLMIKHLGFTRAEVTEFRASGVV